MSARHADDFPHCRRQPEGKPGCNVNYAVSEGPVPTGLPLDALSEVRARFIADAGWGGYADVRAEFAHRDAVLRDFRAYEEVVLWFEHDLYDQLQLLQVLDWFAAQERGATRLSLLGVGAFPGVEPFVGLGQLSPAQLGALYPRREPVTDAMVAIARAAWAAYRAPAPWAIAALLGRDTAALPFLAAALRRHLAQFPSVERGLSRTERHILDALTAGPQRPEALFLAQQQAEEAPFMGDRPMWTYVQRMAQAPLPLVELVNGETFALPPLDGPPPTAFLEQQITLTTPGHTVLAGHADAIHLNGIDRWLGGVHLMGPSAAWRWDSHRRMIEPSDPPDA